MLQITTRRAFPLFLVVLGAALAAPASVGSQRAKPSSDTVTPAGAIMAYGQAPAIRRDGKALRGIHQGTALYAGDVIASAPKGNLDFYLAGVAVVRLRPNSTVELEPVPPASPQSAPEVALRLQVVKGAILQRILKPGEPPLETQTPGAVVNSGGAAFRVRWNAERRITSVVTAEGQARVAPRGGAAPELLVGARQKLLVRDGLRAAAQPVDRADEAEVQELLSLVPPADVVVGAGSGKQAVPARSPAGLPAAVQAVVTAYKVRAHGLLGEGFLPGSGDAQDLDATGGVLIGTGYLAGTQPMVAHPARIVDRAGKQVTLTHDPSLGDFFEARGFSPSGSVLGMLRSYGETLPHTKIDVWRDRLAEWRQGPVRPMPEPDGFKLPRLVRRMDDGSAYVLAFDYGADGSRTSAPSELYRLSAKGEVLETIAPPPGSWIANAVMSSTGRITATLRGEQRGGIARWSGNGWEWLGGSIVGGNLALGFSSSASGKGDALIEGVVLHPSEGFRSPTTTVLWREDGRVLRAPVPGPATRVILRRFDPYGTAYGFTYQAGGAKRAIRWCAGAAKVEWLDSLTDLPKGWKLERAVVGNTAGEVLVNGKVAGKDAWFVLTPR